MTSRASTSVRSRSGDRSRPVTRASRPCDRRGVGAGSSSACSIPAEAGSRRALLAIVGRRLAERPLPDDLHFRRRTADGPRRRRNRARRTWTPRHTALRVQGQPRARSAPRIFGHETEATSRVQRKLAGGTSLPLAPAGLVAEQDLPSEQNKIDFASAPPTSSAASVMSSPQP